jgi:hypothetical protein
VKRAVVTLVLLVAAPSAFAGDPAVAQFDRDDSDAGWSTKKSKDGVTLEQRNVSGSSFREYRSVVEVPVDPAFAAAEVWSALRSGDMEDLKHREILREQPDRLIIHDQIRTAVVTDRDYVIEVTRRYDPATRRTQFRCVSTTDALSPAPAKGYVRVPVVRAGWMTEPGADGGTKLTYYAYSEPGGPLPAFLIRGAQADRSLADVLRMVRRLRSRSSSAAR